MDPWRFHVFLTLLICLLAVDKAQAQQAEEPLIAPQIERRELLDARVDSSDVELGLFAGQVAIEDFGSTSVVGLTLAYHITDHIYTEASYGQATAGLSSFEVLSGGAPLLTDAERDYQYYDLSVGYNINGELFLTDSLAFNTDLYFAIGGGNTDFAGNSQFTAVLNGGYRVLINDYVSVRLDVRDRIFRTEVTGQEKTTHNIQYSLGVTLFF